MLLLHAVPACAQSDQTIRFYMAGVDGRFDVAMRAFAARLAAAQGAAASFDSRPGLLGASAAALRAARAAPDGRTLFIAGDGPLAINPASRVLPYDPVRDFAPVTLLAMAPFVLVARPDLRAETLQEVVALARSQPGRLRFGSGGVGSGGHLALASLGQLSGIDLAHASFEVPRGGLIVLASGQAQLAMATVAALQARTEPVKLIAAASRARLASRPDLATFSEAGVAGFEAANWIGLVAPAGVTEPILQRLRSDAARLLEEPELQRQLRAAGSEHAQVQGADFAAFLRLEVERWGKVAAAEDARKQASDEPRRRATLARDLHLPSETRTLGRFNDVANQIFRPEGRGPFPAIVYLHTCGGINIDRNAYWTQAALKQGYAVLVLDSLGPRRVDTMCDMLPYQDKSGVNLYRGLKDTADALEHLAKLPEIDSRRIALVGFSWGAMVAKYAAGSSLAVLFTPRRYAALASFYPGCGPYLQFDTDRPLLLLLGELDDESPPEPCVTGMGWLKERGAPVEWEVYPGATHAWDEFREVVRKTNRGIQVRYVPNPQVREESARRLFEFLDRHLGKPGAGQS
jgi:tripartite-type tricarboxylate transporter receptor subunit TctC/predicted esterase